MGGRRLAAVALLSAAALAYELLLIRWLSITQWYPFATLVISLALLGHGVAGTLLTLSGRRATRHFEIAFPAAAAGFTLSVPLCTWLAQHTGFNGLELVWDPWQLLRLTALYGVLTLPFIFAAACFGLAFMRHDQASPTIYAADLAGAGLGAATLLLALLWLPPPTGLKLIAAAGLIAAMLAAARPRRIALPALLVLAALLLLPDMWLRPVVSEYKGLPSLLKQRGAEQIDQRHSPYGWLAVVRNDTVPPRHAPGLSLTAQTEPPAQLAVSVDGDALRPITARTPERLDFLGQMLSAAPYALIERPRVLVLGAGGGLAVLQALELGADEVTAVELNPVMNRLVAEDYADFAGHLYAEPRVQVIADDPRGFVRDDRGRYELIQLGSADSLAAAGAGVGAAAEAYALTVEAFADYYDRLTPNGLLAVLRWSRVPPRDILKLTATAAAALERHGTAEPGRHLAVLRNWDSNLLLLKRRPFTPPELAALRGFAQRLSFDLAWLPDIGPDEVNRVHRLEGAPVYGGIRALLGPDAAGYSDDYKFQLQPATDDRPFFHHFFKWRTLPELLRLRERGGAVLLDSGYLVQAGGLVQALLLSLLLILGPLAVLRRPAGGPARGRPVVYFTGLGLGFLFIEIACIQRFTLILGHPLIAAAGVITAFLLLAGLGSALAQRWSRRRSPARTMRLAIIGIVISGLALTLAFARLDQPGAGLLAGLALLPLAMLMGMPLPLGLARLGQEAPEFLPWAWGINGCASVISALLAGLLAIHIGYTALIASALALYALAALAWPPAAGSV